MTFLIAIITLTLLVNLFYVALTYSFYNHELNQEQKILESNSHPIR